MIFKEKAMDDSTFVPKKTTWGIVLMTVSFLIELISTVIGLTLVGSQTDPSQLANTALTSVPAMVQGCLAPLVIVLALIGVILVLVERKKLPTPHPRLALLALVAYILMAVSNLGVGLPMSFMSTQSGNLYQAVLGLWGSLLGSILSAVYPVLLVFGAAKPPQRGLLGLAGLAGIASAAGMGGLTLSNFQLKAMEFSGMTIYYPQPGINLSSSLYQALSVGSIAATVLFFLAYLWLAVDYFGQMGKVVDERVV
jgi:hypothetical protein